MKKVAIMQPYFLPYIGYFQLMNYVDEFVIYDNIEYTKKGWINRNRMLQNGKDAYFTLPLKKDSDYLNVNQRFLAESYSGEKIKILNRIKSNYGKAPYFAETYILLKKIFNYQDLNLFGFIFYSISILREYLAIDTIITRSSSINIDHTLKSQDKVLAIAKELRTNIYVNPIGGVELYVKEIFRKQGLDLQFLKTNFFEYPQFENRHISFLSILDVLMFNDLKLVKDYLSEYQLL